MDSRPGVGEGASCGAEAAIAGTMAPNRRPAKTPCETLEIRRWGMCLRAVIIVLRVNG